MLKVIHVRETHLLQLLKSRKICLPQNKKFEVGEKFILDTENETALVEILGLNNIEALISIKEIQAKLFPPF